MKPDVLLLDSMLPAVEQALERAYTVHRPADITSSVAQRITAVATGGGIGLPAEWQERLPALGLVAVHGVGTDQVDLGWAKARGVRVTTTPGVLTDDVADMAVGLMLAVLRRIGSGDRMVRAGRWAAGDKPLLGRSPRGRCLGILGLGQIGVAVAERGQVFGMDIAYYNRSDVQAPAEWSRCPTPLDLAARCDVLAVCIAATAATESLVNRDMLDALGADGVLINVARGSVVDENELISALADGRIAAAGLDVFRDEPTIRTDFHGLDNAVLVPHQGSATVETREAMGQLVLDNLEAFFAGEPLPTAVV